MMKNNILSVIGYVLSSIFVMVVWGEFYQHYSLLGGLIAAGLIIGLFYYINHQLNLVNNQSDSVFIDMAVSIGLSAIVRDCLMYGWEGLNQSFPTIIIVIVGGVLGAIVAFWLEE
ncbi:hypothetical protein IU403_05185 [Aerococcaceae bacterium zg-BR22]|uniref:Lin0368 family putative glycerol transporter subunit n=1 Tax=Aerococcaceae bacterium zg-1292 TaxID=2774330 RepID=UPI00406295B9|nr:hypothetical protein [Aerococcaceae bacterium zg-BR22]